MERRGVMVDLVQLIEPFIPGLRRYARSLLKASAAADDLVQNTLETQADPIITEIGATYTLNKFISANLIVLARHRSKWCAAPAPRAR